MMNPHSSKHCLKPFFILFIVSLLFISCDSSTKESSVDDKDITCIHTHDSDERKKLLENSIRGKIKFIDEEEKLASIFNQMTAYNIPAVSLAIIDKGEIAWSQTYQNEQILEQSDLDCTSLFQAASLSKPVTFLAALRMHAAGKIDLDKDIQDYLISYELPQGKQSEENPVTFRNIFSHTSGISYGGYQGYDRDTLMPTDIEVLKGSEGVNTPAIQVISAPNESLVYSGGAYTLSEVALQDIFKDNFANIMKQWILDPAGMDHSEFTQPMPESRSDEVAKGFSPSGKMIDGGWRNHPEQAAAGLWSNAADMAKFLLEIFKAYQGKSAIFSQEDIRTILAQERDGHVYGFIINREGEEISLTHYGGNAGYRTGMTISLTTGKGLAYLINSDNGGSLGNELLLSASQVYDWQQFGQTEVRRKKVSSEDLKGMAGVYKWNEQIDLSITYKEDNDFISLFFPNGDEYKLFGIEGENDQLELVHPNTGVAVAFEDDLNSFSLYGRKAVRKSSEE